MGITTALCNTFKQELLQGIHAFGTDTFKLALIKSGESGTYGPATTNYSDVTGNSDEIGNTGSYSAGGATLTNVAVTGGSGASTAFVDFDNVQFTNATIDANGAIIYNSSDSNKAVCVLDFTSNKSSTSGTFTIQFPTADASNAIIRIA